MSNQKTVTIIPARGGSKGIHRKNLVDINGKPMLYYTITASLLSLVDETWVSSEDQEILAVAKDIGALTLERPSSLASDTASSESVLFHFTEHVAFDKLIFLQATSPLTEAEDINRAIEMLEEYDSVLSVATLTQFVWINGHPNYDIQNRKRRQETEETYLETGGLFATTRENLLKYKNRIGGRIGFLKVPRLRSFDVDTYDDLDVIRRLIR
ncbi:MAG: acylneuraminate cytidylyltransferase family protein [Calditrichaeota bacterium]|nr:acylneuraminate cytidylyltransferase family protein [Calditrichota bacterium]